MMAMMASGDSNYPNRRAIRTQVDVYVIIILAIILFMGSSIFCDFINTCSISLNDSFNILLTELAHEVSINLKGKGNTDHYVSSASSSSLLFSSSSAAAAIAIPTGWLGFNTYN